MSATTQSYSVAQTEVQRLTTLYELLGALTRATSVEDVYQAALVSLLEATSADRAAILTFDPDGVMRFKAWQDLSPEYRQAVTGHTPWPQGTKDAQPVVIPDVQLEDSLDAFQTVLAREEIRALVFVPLNLESGVIGKFMLYYAGPHDCTADELASAQMIAGHVALVLERKRSESEYALLLEREQAARKTAELLNRVSLALAAELDPETLVQSITDRATELVGAQMGVFFHNFVDDRGESHLLYTLSGVPRETFAHLPPPRKTDILGPTYRGEAIVRSTDVTQDPRYGRHAPFHGLPKGHPPVRSYLAAPVISRSGEVLGGLFFGHPEPGKFTEQHEAILAGLAAQAAIALDNAHLFEQAQWIQNELKRSNEELRRANQDLEMFAYSASHDLQEPLRTIAVSAQLLERRLGDQLEGEARQLVDIVVDGAHRMQNLIHDVLAYAMATRYAEGPPPATDAGCMLGAALENLGAQITASGAVVTADPLPAVLIHENRLVQLFQNLIGNALKYKNNGTPRIHVSAAERDGWSVFSVADNGIGVDPKFAEHIFGLFKRLHGRREYPGSGIGLAICQRIVEQYGGRIWLETSAPDKGATFCFTLRSSGR